MTSLDPVSQGSPQPLAQGVPSRDDSPMGVRMQRGLDAGLRPNYAMRALLDFESEITGEEGAAGAALGAAASVGKGVLDAGLSMLRGAQWLGYNYGLGQLLSDETKETYEIPGDVEGVLEKFGAREAALRLESRLSKTPNLGPISGRAAGGVVGDVASLVASGGTSGIIGKTLGAPGTAIKALGFPGAKLGEALISRAPTVGRWAKLAQAVPQTMASSTGFGLYNYVTAEGGFEERSAAALHGALAGAVLHVTGELGKFAEARYLSRLTPSAEKARWRTEIEGLERGKVDIAWWDKMGAKAMSSSIEATGFAGLSKEWWGDLTAGVAGDEEAMDRAMSVYAGSLAGVLTGKLGDTEAFGRFRREMPEANTLDLRLLAEQVRTEPKDAEWRFADVGVERKRGTSDTGGDAPLLEMRPSGKGEPALLPDVPRGAHEGNAPDLRRDERSPEGQGQGQETGGDAGAQGPVGQDPVRGLRGGAGADAPRGLHEAGGGDVALPLVSLGQAPALRLTTQPLFHSGWEMEPFKPGRGAAEPDPSIEMSFGGFGSVRAFQSGVLEVPADVFRAVRGDVEVPTGTQNIRMEGPVAEEFARDLAAVSMLRRIRGELMFGVGPGEAWAGGPWRDGEGSMHTIGLDGKHYSKPEPSGEAQPWKLEPDAPLPTTDSELSHSPEIQRWMELAAALRKIGTPNPGLDLLDASIALVLRGNPESRSVQETFALLAAPWQQGITNADTAAPLLHPGNIEQFGLTVAQVAAGHLTAERARQQIGTALVGPSRGTLLPAPAPGRSEESGSEIVPPEQPQGATQGAVPTVAGSRDWLAAEPEERRAGAAAYVEEQSAAGKPVEAPFLRDTFGIPRETARDLIARKPAEGREGEAGFAITDPLIAAKDAVVDVYTVAREAHDFAISDQSRSLAKRGGPAGTELASGVRNVLSRTRSLIGHATGPIRQVHKALRKGRRELAEEVTVTSSTGKPYPQLKWVAEVEGKQPSGKESDALNASLIALHEAFRAAGGLRPQRVKVPTAGGKAIIQRAVPPSRIRAITPFISSTKDKGGFDEVMGTDTLRLAYFDYLADTGLSSGLSGADLERLHQESKKPTEAVGPEEQSAIEFMRQVTHPASWTHGGRTFEIREPDPIDAMHRIVEDQAARIATIEEPMFGQDVTQEERAAFGITKPGVSETLKKFVQGINTGSAEENRAVTSQARDLIERMQGDEPEQVGKGLRKARELLSVPRAFGAWLSGIQDVGGAVSEPMVYGGFTRMLQAAWDYAVSTGVRGSVELAAEAGSLQHELGNLDLGMATTPLARFAEFISKPSNWLEKQKTVLFDRLAVRTLRDWTAGRLGDTDLPSLLKLTPQEGAALLGGTASPTLMRKFRHEIVQVMTSRGRRAERSRMAASPTWTALVRYTGFATRRLQQIETELGAFFKAMEPGTTWARKGYAAKRLALRVTGMQIGGLIGTYLYYVLSDLLFRGENGHARFVREMTDFTGATMGRAFTSQLLSGPFSVMYQAAVDDPGKAVRLTEPTNLLHGAMETFARGGSVFDVLYRGAENTGFVPRQLRTVATSVALAVSGEKGYDELARSVTTWKRLKGIKPVFSEPDKQLEFYDAMRSVKSTIAAHTDADGDLWAKVEPKVREALALQPEESVSAKIRSMRLLSGLDDKEVDELSKHVGDAEMRRIHAHDADMLEIAREASKLDGQEQTPWTSSLEMAENQARLGSTTVWGKMVDRAVDETSERIETGKEVGEQIDELAASMSRYQASVANTAGLFGEREMAALQQPMPIQDIHQWLAGKLMVRARDRAKAQLRDRAKAGR